MLIKILTEACGVSGREGEVRQLIRGEVEGYVDEVNGDYMGNLFAWKRKNGRPLVMLAAHMDEVGLMVMGIDNEGLLSFSPVGGIDPRVLVGKKVLVGKEKINGVIGSKPIHMQEKHKREKPFPSKELFIDIGAENQEQASREVNVGDYVAFDTATVPLKPGVLQGKAFDDRAGCAAIIEILKEDLPVGICGCFTVQEEVGSRGAGVAAFRVNPDIAFVLEGTTASDVPECVEHRYSTSMGKGPALTMADRSFLSNPRINKYVMDIAERENIPYQLRRTNVGGTDTGRIYQTKSGIPAAGFSLPCRYIHSPVSMLNIEDYNNMVKWMKAILYDIGKGGFPFERID